MAARPISSQLHGILDLPGGVEANAAMGARTIGVGTASGGGGIGSGSAEPASPNARP